MNLRPSILRPTLAAALGVGLFLAADAALAQQPTGSVPAESSPAGPPPPQTAPPATLETGETETAAVAARVRLALDAGLWITGPTFGNTLTIPDYAEQTSIEARYETTSSFGPDLALQYRLGRRYGLELAFSTVTRDEETTFDVSRPHPLYLDEARQTTASLQGYEYSEKAVHLDLVYTRVEGRWEWSVFAGPTLFDLSADMLEVAEYQEAYPYDEFALTGSTAKSVGATAFGFNAGLGVDCRFGAKKRFGAGARLRYSWGSADLNAPADGGKTSITAGGLQSTAGLRVYF